MQRYYFDYNATTPVCPEALAAMLPVFLEDYGNASSIHQFGQAAKQRLEHARRQIARFIGCDNKEIVFTSGGTEANNLAILSVVRAHSRPTKHVITSAIEHPAVLNPCAQLEREGVAVTRLPVGSDGRVDAEAVRGALRQDTVLISIMHANNETGVLQPISEIAEIARAANVPVHVDGIQACGKVPVNVGALGVDFYSLSGHKLYAPKGIGVLFVREGSALNPILYGGRHENGRRAGTENVAGAVSLGRAVEVIAGRLASETSSLGELRDRLERMILEQVPGAGVHGGTSPRVPNTTNIHFPGIEGESLLIALDLRGFAVSSGPACSSGVVVPSHVLLAMGASKEQARASLRFSLGHSNTVEQVDELVAAIVACTRKLRHLSPTYAARA